MKSILISQFTKSEEELTDILMSLGYGRNVATTLTMLKSAKCEITATAIERKCGLRQPEVSITMRELIERGWVDENEQKKVGKGRPFKLYSLKVKFSTIITILENEQKLKAASANSRIEKLKRLSK
jgi:predicted transcriptional regulator